MPEKLYEPPPASYDLLATPLLESFQKDDVCSKFLDPNLDTNAFASSVIKAQTVTQCREKLSAGIASLQEELRTEVIDRHDELLRQVSSLQNLDSMLSLVNAGVHSLQASVNRLKGDLSEPYEKMRGQTIQLSRVLAATHMLRRVQRFLQLMAALRQQLYGSQSDLAKAAQALYDLETELKEKDLRGLTVVEDEVYFVKEAGAKIRADGLRMLERGLEDLNQTETGSALQVFYNIRCLSDEVGGVIARVTDHVERLVHNALDLTTIADDTKGAGGLAVPGGARSAMPPAGRQGAWRASVWTRVETMLEAVHSSCVQVWHLQRVLAKKRDPATRACFLDDLVSKGELSITQSFWRSVTEILKQEMEYACKASSFLQDTLVADYPKLLRMFNDYFSKLSTQIRNFGGAMTGAEEQHLLEGALQGLETMYLASSLQRLNSRTSAVFASTKGSAPARTDVEGLMKLIADELSSVSAHPLLCASVGRNVSRALRTFAANTEQGIVTSGEAIVLGKGTTAAQSTNATLCNNVTTLVAALSSVMQTLPGVAIAPLEEAVRQLEQVAEQSLTPIIAAATKKLENTLLAMHKEDWTKGPGDASTTSSYSSSSQTGDCSRYMRVVVRQLNTLRDNALALYSATPMLHDHCRRLAARLVVFFVRHLALVRPLSEQGKLKMAADMAQMELALGPLCAPLTRLGAPYKALRALRPLLFLETSAIPTCSEKDALLPSTVLHHMFSRGPEELQLPHERLGQTEAQYSDWMDTHSEADVWLQCAASLDAYARKVSARGDPQFTPVYPVILSLGLQLLDTYSKRQAATTNGST